MKSAAAATVAAVSLTTTSTITIKNKIVSVEGGKRGSGKTRQ